MADDKKDDGKVDKKETPSKRISVDQRMNYIGFDVFPGKPKDLFKSSDEQKKFVDGIIKKRESGEKLREECTLLEERVNWRDRMVLTVTSVVIVLALFLPWYSAYNEIVEETTEIPTESAITPDTTMPAAAEVDSLGQMIMDTVGAVGSMTEPAPTQSAAAEPERNVHSYEGERSGEELITAYKAKKKVHKEVETATGIGGILMIGSAGSYIFGSGIVLILTAIIFLVYTLLCIALPAYTLYGIYGLKGDPDAKALALKRVLRFNWLPVILFAVAALISFVGAGYGFNAAEFFTSLGSSYSVAVFAGSVSWGVFVSMAAFILLAAKGIEI